MDPGSKAILFLNDNTAGEVIVQRSADSWCYGVFHPSSGFEPFAPVFGRWSLLMHADENAERLSEAASDELRRCEYELLKIHGKLFFPESNRWVDCAQINIDGMLIEWKSF